MAALLPRLPGLALGVAEELLGVYNDAWRPEGAPVESSASFATRIQLEGLDIETNGELSLWYHDDDLFTGHGIRVAIGPEGVLSANLVSSRTSDVPAFRPPADVVRGAVVERQWCGRDRDGTWWFLCTLSPGGEAKGRFRTKPLFVICPVKNVKAAKAIPELHGLAPRAVVALRCRFMKEEYPLGR